MLNISGVKNILIGILCFSAFVSCSDDNVGGFKLSGDISSMIPEYSYGIKSYSTYDENTFVVSPFIYDKLKEWGLSIKQINYYLDGELYETVNEYPYCMILKGSDMVVGDHVVKADFTIVGDACDAHVCTEDSVLKTDPEKLSKLHGDFFIRKNEVCSGDMLTVTPELLKDRSADGCTIRRVEYFWDDSLVCVSADAPYTFRYKVDEEVHSRHNLKVHIFYYDNTANSIQNVSSSDVYVWDEKSFPIAAFNVKSGRIDYKYGEKVSFVSDLYVRGEAPEGAKVEIFIDDRKIAESSTFPFNYDYQVSELRPGKYNASAKFTYSQNGQNETERFFIALIVTE